MLRSKPAATVASRGETGERNGDERRAAMQIFVDKTPRRGGGAFLSLPLNPTALLSVSALSRSAGGRSRFPAFFPVVFFFLPPFVFLVGLPTCLFHLIKKEKKKHL